ncbi:sodium:calcium antiporter [Flammeovirga sp. MY04]|uniref:sodium:calcium antiporter n=1 Tax=Flammeovirga sp. MY04 TaxID=1191459 RepID=UPI00082523BC|nr:sodium:calcium antiporter [Flammeovirga sp. MY04]ANQ48770.2 sodium:calcium antiporter [Flammeovirga sp. MY04]
MDTLLFHIFLGISGILLMRYGALLLTKGATALSGKSNFSGVHIGLTVVALGTSIPEICVSTISVYKDAEALAFGTIIGSNTFNIVFGLGISALIIRVRVLSKNIWRDTLFALGSGCLLFFLLNKKLFFNAEDNFLTPFDAFYLIGYLITYYIIIFASSKNKKEIYLIKKIPQGLLHHHNIARDIIVGLLIIGGGAYISVIEALLLSEYSNLSARFIGVSIMAICTSLPEIITTISVMRRKRQDIAFGNIMGSYIINYLLASSILTIKGPIHYDYTLNYDLTFSILACLLCAMLSLSSRYLKLTKMTSFFLLSLGILYYITTYLRG